MTELSGIELREAVATALGWTVSEDRGDGEMYRLDLANGLRPAVPLVPHFDSSLDACFAPGGPVERLREFYEESPVGDASWAAYEALEVCIPKRTNGASVDVGWWWQFLTAEAVCRAFLAAVSKPVERALVENLEGQE